MSQIEAAKAEGSAVSPGYRYYVLAILIFVYMLNFVDRQIIGILAAPWVVWATAPGFVDSAEKYELTTALLLSLIHI